MKNIRSRSNILITLSLSIFIDPMASALGPAKLPLFPAQNQTPATTSRNSAEALKLRLLRNMNVTVTGTTTDLHSLLRSTAFSLGLDRDLRIRDQSSERFRFWLYGWVAAPLSFEVTGYGTRNTTTNKRSVTISFGNLTEFEQLGKIDQVLTNLARRGLQGLGSSKSPSESNLVVKISVNTSSFRRAHFRLLRNWITTPSQFYEIFGTSHEKHSTAERFRKRFEAEFLTPNKDAAKKTPNNRDLPAVLANLPPTGSPFFFWQDQRGVTFKGSTTRSKLAASTRAMIEKVIDQMEESIKPK